MDKAVVIKELQNYLESEKIVGVLSGIKKLPGSEEPKTCFCIEGVFCDVASKLGYEGKFVTESDKRSRVFVYQKRTELRCNAAQQVYYHLGIPYVVPLVDIREAGLKDRLNNRIYYRTFFRDGHEAVSWPALNDESNLTLRELIDFTCNLLQKNGQRVNRKTERKTGSKPATKLQPL
jgi:hypothetical protein